MPTARICGFKQAAIVAMQQKGFSSVEHVARGGAKLTKALDKELKYENDNYAQQEDIDTFIAEAGWSFTEEENGIKMTLSKMVGDKKVEVIFEARQPQADEENQQQDE